MNGLTEIPHIRSDEDTKPGWISTVDGEGKPQRPVVRCQCGQYIGLTNHHVHADGTVTASFFDTSQPFMWGGKQVHNPNGCNWHVFLKLKDYDGGEFPPET
jgi:hypothetical protein